MIHRDEVFLSDGMVAGLFQCHKPEDQSVRYLNAAVTALFPPQRESHLKFQDIFDLLSG
jgi:hypothetical protein